MPDYMTLMGAEDVRAAGSAMRRAADQMSSAASAMQYAVDQQQRHLEQFIFDFRSLVERMEALNRPGTAEAKIGKTTHHSGGIF